MIHREIRWALVLFAASVASAIGQISISGVADRQTYANSVTFTIAAQSGWAYSAFLNSTPVAVGAAVTVNRADFYQLLVMRTNTTSGAVESLLRRFIVFATERGSPASENTELGLPVHTPWPVIQSSTAEFEGAALRVIAPADFPAGYEIPVVAWVIGPDGHAVRANGLLESPGQRSIQLRRGVGSGLLTSNQPPGVLDYSPSVGGLTASKQIQIEATPAWTSVSGSLVGTTLWPDGSRIRVTGDLAIPAGSALTVEAGAIVLLGAGVNIVNDGSVLINGTVERPVVFMPASTNQPWGGFFMRTSTGVVTGTGVLFTGSGADPNGGAGHRDEQCLFFVDNSPRITLTDAAAFDLKGQLGHANNGGTFVFERFLLQRCTTGGEYTGAWFRANDCAFIECPDASADFVNGDNDALYFVNAPAQGHGFTNTLFGWTKDDGIDSGGSGFGPLSYQSCWFEAIFHEGNSLSGYKNTRVWDTVYLDCGQGIENGYDGPTGRVERCLFTDGKAGVRHGDNYQGFSGYAGLMIATNCISIYNHRDFFGYNWDNEGGWTNNWGRFIARGNFVTAPDTNFPDNAIWNPPADAWRLGAFGAKGRVGLALAVRPGQSTLASFPDGVPVGLSMYCTNQVSVGYTIAGTDGTQVAGTLVFPPGRLRHHIPVPNASTGVLRVALSDPIHADLTGVSELLFQNIVVATPPAVTLISTGATWKYLDNGSNQGTAWRTLDFDDTGWSNGVAEIGFGDSPRDEATLIRRTNSVTGMTNITFYFRAKISVPDPTQYGTLRLMLKRDDGGVVYINGQEVLRAGMPSGAISYTTFANVNAENAMDNTNVTAAVLQPGMNIVAAEIHQRDLGSSDISFQLSLQAVPAVPATVNITRLGQQPVIYWTDPLFNLEQTDQLPAQEWTPAGVASPISINPTNTLRIFRLKR